MSEKATTEYYVTTRSAPEYVKAGESRVRDEDDEKYWHSLFPVNAEPSSLESALTQGFPGLLKVLQPTATTTVLGDLGTIGCEIQETSQHLETRGTSDHRRTVQVTVTMTYELVDKGNSYVRYKRTKKSNSTVIQVGVKNKAPVYTYEWFPNPNGKGQLLHIIDDEGSGKPGFLDFCVFPVCCCAPLMFCVFQLQSVCCGLRKRAHAQLAEQQRMTVKYVETFKDPPSGSVIGAQPGATGEAKKFCGKCGKPAVEGSSFCQSCGAAL